MVVRRISAKPSIIPDTNDGITNGDNGTDRDALMSDDHEDDTDTTEKTHVNDAKLGALLYFPLIAIALTSCLGDMYHRNHTMHREPNTARALLVDCPVQDPDQVWLLLVGCYATVVASIGVLCHAMLGPSFSSIGRSIQGQDYDRADVGDDADADANSTFSDDGRTRTTARSARMRVITCRICLVLIYFGMYHYDSCMGNMPYLKKKTAQIYLTCIILFASPETLSVPVIMQTSKYSPSGPPRWPIFLIKIMVFIPYANAGWHKLYMGFSGTTIRSVIMDHYILFEHTIALKLSDHPVIISLSALATLVFECGSWLLVLFGYDRVAAVVAFSFHLGIQIVMNIDYLLFWGCSFVFFFVPSIISSSKFQSIVKTVSGETSALAVGTMVENENVPACNPSAISECVANRGSNSKSKRKQKFSVLIAVSLSVFLAYESFYPSGKLLPDLPKSVRSSFLPKVYEHLNIMSGKPFNQYTMYAQASFPVFRTIPYLVLNQTGSLSSDNTENHRRVKWIPYRKSDEYFVTNMLEYLEPTSKNKRYELTSKRVVTKCNIFACIAKRFILNENSKDWLQEQPRSLRRTIQDIDGPWTVESIEFFEESYEEVEADGNENKNIDNGNSPVAGSLQKSMSPMCAIDIGRDASLEQSGKGVPRYTDGSCEDILTELYASVKSVDATSKQFDIVPVLPLTQKRKIKYDIPFVVVVFAMLVMGYNTFQYAS